MNPIERGVRLDNDIDSQSDLDEPLGIQTADAESSMTHNTSKSNFFASPESDQSWGPILNKGSFKRQVSVLTSNLALNKLNDFST